jgi:homoserine kinase type II
VAVYVELSAEAMAEISGAYKLGRIREVIGIPQGSINSNCRLELEDGRRFFLRVTTVRSAEDLQFEASLLEHLREGRFPGPTLIRTQANAPYVELPHGRATLFHYLAGDALQRSDLSTPRLEALGRELGKLHRVGQSFLGRRENPYRPAVVRTWLEQLKENPDVEVADARKLLVPALDQAEAGLAGRMLPQGPIHADIFLDNVKWIGNDVSAIFDFEMACVDAYVLDVAIALNAWCFDQRYVPELCGALMRGYKVERTLTPEEGHTLFDQALFGAVRYTASRIRDFHLSPLPPDKLFKKDFRTYLARVRALTALGREGLLRVSGMA